MRLAAGTPLGAYRIVAPIGAGGMGEVYRARDSRLGREVAVKVLPEAVAADAERLLRFRREAHVLAALNHPRIAAIYGLEEDGGTPFLVLELVPGDDLAALLAKGPLPVPEALDVARQIAEGLEAAHEAGVIHRDLKPANVKLTPGGEVKLLDFGLAKAYAGESAREGASDLSHSPTLTSPATSHGVILGTAAYMSPEQARGRPVDRRTDVWALGVVLYEMLTGARLFAGETVTDVLAAILTKDADLSLLPARTPPRVRALLSRCLTRDPKQRLRDAGDARLELEEAIRELASGAPAPAAAAPVRVRAIARGLALLLALALGFAAGRLSAPRAAARHAVVRSVVPLPSGLQLAGWASPVLALSPDGRTLAYVAQKPAAVRQLFVHDLASGTTRVAPSSESAEGPFFSPDGQSIAFATGVSEIRLAEGSLLKRYSMKSGLTESVAALEDYFGGCWAADGSIYLVNDQPRGLWRWRPGSRALEHVAATFRSGGPAIARNLSWPQLLPDGRSVLLVEDRGSVATGRAAVVDIAAGTLDDLGLPAASARVTRSGHLLTVRNDGTVLAAPFDPRTRKTRGTPSAVLGGVAFTANNAAALAVSDEGLLAYASGYVAMSRRELTRMIRFGAGGEPKPLAFEPQELSALSVSPDGERAAVLTWDGNVWIWDLGRGSRRPLPDASSAESIAFSPDGRLVAYAGPSPREGAGYAAYVAPADGGAPARQLAVPGHGEELRVDSFTPGGKEVVLLQLTSPWALWLVPTDGATPPRTLPYGSVVSDPRVSPDGRFVAYVSSESGRAEVYVRRLEGSGLVAVSTAGGRWPRWAGDGSELYFLSGTNLMAARVAERDGAPSIGTPVSIGETPPDLFAYEPAPARREFFGLQRVPGSGAVTEIHLVSGFFDELQNVVPNPK